jgi:hypothetical protein
MISMKPPLPAAKSKRLPRGKAVTVIAGFKSYDGIVLCADTQETLEHSKRQIPKLRFEPLDRHGQPEQSNVEDLAVAFCGAGDGPFIDKLVTNAWEEASVATSLDEACEVIERSIKDTYREFGGIYQVGMCPEVQLIYGAKMHRGSRMFSAVGPIVNEKDGYDCAGTGHYMANFLASRMYETNLSVRICVILAAYVLFQCREHVDGCGGESHIAVLREDESSGRVNWKRVEAITELLSQSDHDLGELLLKAADLNVTDKELSDSVAFTCGLLGTFRRNQRRELRDWQEMVESYVTTEGEPEIRTDDLGLPALPSDAQTSEDQQ